MDLNKQKKIKMFKSMFKIREFEDVVKKIFLWALCVFAVNYYIIFFRTGSHSTRRFSRKYLVAI